MTEHFSGYAEAELFDGRRDAPNPALEGVPGLETIIRHAQAAVAADGAPDADLVERVARAIAGSNHDRKGGHPSNRRGYVERTWRIYTPEALAAIGAMRGVGE